MIATLARYFAFHLALFILLISRIDLETSSLGAYIFGKYSTRSCLRKEPTILYFKEEKGGDNDGKRRGPIGKVWQGIKRYLPGVSQAKAEKTYELPSSDAGFRYQLRLVDVVERYRRHTITRLIRYLPDLAWETAEDIVDNALRNEKSLVRVLNSKTEARELVDMLRMADPPISVEVFDTKKGEIVEL